jgi:chromosomal replication initiation ATPase DnaA
MATHLQQKRRAAELALDRVTRMRNAIAQADRALAEYQAALDAHLGRCVEGMEDVHTILLQVCHAYAITPAAILSRVRTADLAEARHMAMALAHVLTPHRWDKIGRFFQRGHGTVQHAIEAHGRRLDTDRAYSKRFEGLLAACQQPTEARKSA